MTWNLWLENLAFGDPGVCGTLHAYSALGFSWSKNCVCRVVPYSFQDMQTADLPSFYSEDSMEAEESRRDRFSSFFSVRYQISFSSIS